MPAPIDRPLPASLPRPGGSRTGGTDEVLRRTAREFEAVLLGQVVQLMFDGLKEGGPFGGGSAEGQWRDLLAQEYGRAMAANGGIGLAAHVERAMRAALPPATTETETADLYSFAPAPRGSEP